jgi:phage gp36-like protein
MAKGETLLMSYATPQNLLEWYGAKELAQIATPDDLIMVPAQLMRLTLDGGNRDAFSVEERAAADSAMTRISAALAESTSLIESYLGDRYSLPIADAVVQTSPLPRACGAMARRLLYDDGVPQEVGQRYELALGWLRDLASSQAGLGSNSTNQTKSAAGLADFTANERIFDQTTLHGFVTDGLCKP